MKTSPVGVGPRSRVRCAYTVPSTPAALVTAVSASAVALAATTGPQRSTAAGTSGSEARLTAMAKQAAITAAAPAAPSVSASPKSRALGMGEGEDRGQERGRERERGREHGECRGHREGRADAVSRPRGDQQDRRAREPAAERGSSEGAQSGNEQPPVP
jgi:hypothetical protein